MNSGKQAGTRVVAVFHHDDDARRRCVAAIERVGGVAALDLGGGPGVRERLGDAEALVSTASGFPTEALRDAPRLRWVHVLAAGVERWAPHVPDGVRLTRLTGSVPRRVAEYVVGHVLAVFQELPAVVDQQRRRLWAPRTLRLAQGRTIAVAGLGPVGRSVAALARAAGLRTAGWSRSDPGLEDLDRWYGPGEFAAFLACGDVVVLALPLTPHTRHILDAGALRAMRDRAWVVNVGRGGLVDEVSLVAALRAGAIGGAVLDVFEQEPLPRASPLWDLPNVVVTPHHSGRAPLEEALELFTENLARWLAGEPLRDEVDTTIYG